MTSREAALVSAEDTGKIRGQQSNLNLPLNSQSRRSSNGGLAARPGVCFRASGLDGTRPATARTRGAVSCMEPASAAFEAKRR